MRNWQRCILSITAGLCLCQLSYASGSNFKATSTTPTYTNVTVNTEVYDSSGWNGDLTVPTKDAVRDKIEALAIVSPFTTTSNVIAPTTSTDNLAVGTSTNLAKFAVSGDTDELQAVIRGYSTQTGKILTVEQSTGTDLFTVSQDGTTIVSGTGTEAMTLGGGTQSTYVVTGNVSGTDTTLTFGNNVDTFSAGLTVTGATTMTGGASMGKALTPKVSTLTDGANVALDLSLGNVFTLTAAGNRTISAPTNVTAGQKFIIIHLASGGTRTLSLDTASANGFRFGSSLVGPLSATTSGKYDYIGCVVNPATLSMDVVAYRQGY